jgi:hypothetical protein
MSNEKESPPGPPKDHEHDGSSCFSPYGRPLLQSQLEPDLEHLRPDLDYQQSDICDTLRPCFADVNSGSEASPSPGSYSSTSSQASSSAYAGPYSSAGSSSDPGALPDSYAYASTYAHTGTRSGTYADEFGYRVAIFHRT